MIKLTRADQLKLEAGKKRGISIPGRIVSVDFYDTDILEKASHKSNINRNKQKQENSNVEEQKLEMEFHEQFFS